ncbi:hypothetical protein Tco_0693009, partial [Tanacetum coccineum]
MVLTYYAKIEFVRPKQPEKPVRKPVKLTAITIKGKGWPKAVNTARPNSAVVNAVRAIRSNDCLGTKAHVRDTCPISQTLRFFDGRLFLLGRCHKEGNITVSRKNNMYSVDMKNIVSKESLTCLVAKATLDESMLWHKRL